MVVLDTNTIIDHLRQGTVKSSVLVSALENKNKSELALSIISIQELYAGKSTLSSQAEEALLTTIGPLQILPYSYEIAQKAGELMRDSLRLITFADAAIAATCIVNGASLFTLNRKDFVEIGELRLEDFK